MLTKRIVPCLDIRNGKLVKGVNFKGISDVGDPVEAAAYYNTQGADELVFYDITAAVEGRGLFTDQLSRVASQVTVPLTVGGGIHSLGDMERVLACGAHKVSINSGAIRNPKVIEEAAKQYGSSHVVLSMDVKKVEGEYRVFGAGGRLDTGLNALEWARQGQEQGAGELVVNSIDADGVQKGFDLELLRAIRKVCSLPIVASGGAGSMEHFLELFQKTEVEAGLAASVFHFRRVSIPPLKAYLSEHGVPVQTTAASQ